VAAFVVATDGTMVAALLPQMASTLSVAAAAAGQAVTAYALGYALGGPLIIGSARRVPQRPFMVLALGGFAAANVATALARSLPALLAARLAAGGCAGVFIAVAAATAARSAAPRRRGRALSIIVGGSSAGTAFGVPLGTLAAGAFSWPWPFLGLAAVAALTAVGIAVLSPPPDPSAEPARAVLPRRAVLPTLAITLLWATGSFTFFTYISVILHQTAAVGASGLAGFLLVFGVAGIGGAVVGGRLTDRVGPLPALIGGLAVTALSLAGLALIAAAATGHAAALASLVAVAGYGCGTWAITPPQQQRLVAADADDRFLLALNASALYAGVALGGAIGGITLTLSHSAPAVCGLAAGIELAAVTLAGLTAYRARPHRPSRAVRPDRLSRSSARR
jgi:predicted MFS family arabinose efflux permease